MLKDTKKTVHVTINEFTKDGQYQGTITSDGTPGEPFEQPVGANTLVRGQKLPSVYPETNTLYKVFVTTPRDQKKLGKQILLGLGLITATAGVLIHKYHK